jgi:predicted nucleic acid-binding protein
MENPSKRFLIEEKHATRKIIEKIHQSSNFEIISSKTQLDQVYIKKNSSNTSAQDKNALDFIIAQIETISSNYQQDPINTSSIRDEILSKTTLPDREDARHIAIAWLSCCDFFITIDWNTILNLNKSRMVESALSSIPTFSNYNINFEITDARTFTSQYFP